MIPILQRLVLSFLQRGALTFGELFTKISEIKKVTEIGLKRTLTKLKNGDQILQEEGGKYSCTNEGMKAMSSQGNEYAASQKVNKKKKKE